MVFHSIHVHLCFSSSGNLNILSFFVGHLNVLKVLIENKGDVNAKDAHSETPLHLASMEGWSRNLLFLFQIKKTEILLNEKWKEKEQYKFDEESFGTLNEFEFVLYFKFEFPTN